MLEPSFPTYCTLDFLPSSITMMEGLTFDPWCHRRRSGGRSLHYAGGLWETSRGLVKHTDAAVEAQTLSRISHPAGMTLHRRTCLQPVSCNQRARHIRPSADVMSEFLPFSGCANWYWATLVKSILNIPNSLCVFIAQRCSIKIKPLSNACIIAKTILWPSSNLLNATIRHEDIINKFV